MNRILITGVGLSSRALHAFLTSKGYDIVFLTRNPEKHSDLNAFKWDLKSGTIDLNAFKNVSTLIHLAGTGISTKRWSKKRKLEILNSRVDSTHFLFETIKKHNIKINTFIGASAIGYYGTLNSQKTFMETDAPGSDFLAETCVKWERELLRFNELNIRTVILRTAVVLSKNGGAFNDILIPIKNNFGAFLGKGNQYFPWIHMEDLQAIYYHCIENKTAKGIYNAVSPDHITNKEITTAIAKKLNKKLWLPNIPKVILLLVFGEMAILLLYGSKISSNKIIANGFEFKYGQLSVALKELI